MLTFTTCVSLIPIIYGTKFDIYIEKLKRQIQRQHCHKKTKAQMPLCICRFAFLFLHVYLEFGSENYRDGRHISCEHAYLFQFLKTWKFKFLYVISWYHVNSGTMWYFPVVLDVDEWLKDTIVTFMCSVVLTIPMVPGARMSRCLC
jgi:hypothetical protein